MNAIPSNDITGLILCGGRGTRMGGVDKGLQAHEGRPLVEHALERLRPQVGPVLINANRNQETYKALGVPVWPDPVAGYPGPLAGWVAGLEHCDTPFLLTVPCDSPQFPHDLAARLALALQAEEADVAVAATREDGAVQLQPVFCLLKTSLTGSLQAFLDSGRRKVDQWTGEQRCATVVFDDAAAFFNANTLDDLRTLAQRR